MAFKKNRFVYSDPEIYFDASDYELAEDVILDLAQYVQVIHEPMRGAKVVAQLEMKRRFTNQTAPDGSRWVPLEPEYAERKLREVGVRPILTREGDLSEAASSEEAWDIVGEQLIFDTSALPDYWPVHQFGSADFGTFFHPSFVDSGLEGSGGENPTNIPPRPFIGLSIEASSQIFNTFETWFSYGVENASKKFAVSSQGTLQTRIGGRFGPKPVIG